MGGRHPEAEAQLADSAASEAIGPRRLTRQHFDHYG
jgi:hypothetical protein